MFVIGWKKSLHVFAALLTPHSTLEFPNHLSSKYNPRLLPSQHSWTFEIS